ncbi:MAG: NAD(+) synthase [Betaproteobacteria bacterium]|nr:NAD(+) synthase [Betaproteobacteria bacterium]
MNNEQPFFNLYRHDFIRVAVAIPEVRVADPGWNAARTVDLMREAARRQACLVAFPELGLTAYSCEDLFHQEALLTAGLQALSQVVQASADISLVAVVGLPIRHRGLLYNCAAVVCQGRLLGVVPKTYLPNYREYYEARHFAAGDEAPGDTLDLPGFPGTPFGTRLQFQATNQPLFVLAVEICEDLWVPIPPSSIAALAGASVIVNPSASNATIGKEAYRRQLVSNQSGRCLSAYLYSASGRGESTTDLAWDGHGLIADYGEIKAESERFADRDQLIIADVDLLRLHQERMRQNTFGETVSRFRDAVEAVETIPFVLPLPDQDLLPLQTPPLRYPYVPSDPRERNARCRDVFHIQVQGLVTRLKSTGIKRLVLGISGGLDSAHALLVAVEAANALQLPHQNILAYTLPGFATSERSLGLAHRLMGALGVSATEIDIRPSCLQMLKDIGHPFHDGEPVYDITFENVQAGERTSHLFRLANQHGALVVGTSDLSELALGWSTYGVGDHMSHYHVNASVPKTLIQYLIRWVMENGHMGQAVSEVLAAVLASDISPELVPEHATNGVQRSEETVGPYPLQDFNLYHTLRFGFGPERVAFLSWCAWRDPAAGEWPNIPEADRTGYGIGEIRHWLEVFVKRFFQASQFKRSCIANAPKVGSGGSLSPRGDWRAPSDGVATPWLKALERVPQSAPEPQR